MEHRKKQQVMLQQFTWQQFLIAALVFSFIWYAGVILIFYRDELKAFLAGQRNPKHPNEPLPHRWDDENDLVDNENEETLIGETRLPEGMSTVSMNGFGFTRSEDSKDDQIGLVPDVLEEIKSVFSTLAKDDGNKKDFFNLMKTVSEKYPRIGSNSNIGYINEFIADHASFHLSTEELEDLWI